MRDVLHEIRVAWRRLWRWPGFTLTVAAIVGLGIGANAIAFSFLSGIVLRPLPFGDPDRLVSLWSTRPSDRVEREDVSYPDFVDWRTRSQSTDLATFATWRLTLTTPEGPERLSALAASPNLFDVLGVHPQYGRTFRQEEGTQGRDRVVLLTHGLWQRRFGADPRVVGTTTTLNGEPYEIIGVLPASFLFPTPSVEMWKPLALGPRQSRGSRWLQVVGRLRDGVSLDQARHELSTIAAGIEREDPEFAKGWQIGVAPLQDVIVGNLGAALTVLQVLLGLVVIVTCANVTNLMLARARAQERDTAVKLALGASRSRVMASTFFENLLLAGLGAAVGWAIAVGGVRASKALLPPGTDDTNFGDIAGHSFPRLSEVSVDGWVLAFSVLLCLVMALVFTWVAFTHIHSRDLQSTLTETGRTVGRSGSRTLVRGLVVAEIAAALVLLIGAGLLSRSFLRIVRVDPGFRSERVQTMELSLRQYRDNTQRAAFIQRVLGEIRGVPGVDAAGFSTSPPFTGASFYVDFQLEAERGAMAPNERPRALHHAADAGYFAALQIPLRRGRLFDEHDTAQRPGVVIANEALVRKYGVQQDLLGQRIVVGDDTTSYEIVGIVGDTLQSGLETNAGPELFFAYQQAPPWYMRLTVRTAGLSAAPMASVRQRIRAVDPTMTFRAATAVDDLIGNSLMQRRLQVTLIDLAGGLALVLAILGIYAIILHSVTERRHEIGVRMAMGAERNRVIRMIIGDAARLSIIGIILGLVVAFSSARLLSRFLFGVSATDAVVFTAAPLIILGIALAASYLPARRAARIDPASLLKYE